MLAFFEPFTDALVGQSFLLPPHSSPPCFLSRSNLPPGRRREYAFTWGRGTRLTACRGLLLLPSDPCPARTLSRSNSFTGRGGESAPARFCVRTSAIHLAEN